MKVIELIKKLNKCDENLEVFCYCEDSNLLKDNQGFIILDIESVDKMEAEKVRINEITPSLKIGKGSNSQTFAIINVTSDF